MKKKHAVVFLKNRIISFDSILPLAIELNRCNGFRFEFLIWQDETYRTIINDNIVIRDMALDIGSIKNIDKRKYGRILNKVNKLLSVGMIIVKHWLRNDYIFHFGALREYPLRVLPYFIRQKYIVLCESSILGRYITDNKYTVVDKTYTYSDEQFHYFRSTNDIFLQYVKSTDVPIIEGVLVAFGKDWNWFKHLDSNKCKKLVFDQGKKSKSYSMFLENNIDRYLREEGLDKLDHSRSISFILGHIGAGGERNNYKNELLYEVFLALLDINVNIILKPHMYCDMDIVNSIIDSVPGIRKKIHITKLHPQILSKISVIGLFSNTSTVRCEFKECKLPVVQYRP
jgi:hypothetical protein